LRFFYWRRSHDGRLDRLRRLVGSRSKRFGLVRTAAIAHTSVAPGSRRRRTVLQATHQLGFGAGCFLQVGDDAFERSDGFRRCPLAFGPVSLAARADGVVQLGGDDLEAVGCFGASYQPHLRNSLKILIAVPTRGNAAELYEVPSRSGEIAMPIIPNDGTLVYDGADSTGMFSSDNLYRRTVTKYRYFHRICSPLIFTLLCFETGRRKGEQITNRRPTVFPLRSRGVGTTSPASFIRGSSHYREREAPSTLSS
jgi:hypothetical protein